jgi:thiol-disulfide isomerase/thioredoxin
MKTLILTFCISTLLFLNTNAHINFHIQGKIDRSDIDKIYILYENRVIDSTDVKSGSFDMHGSYEEPSYCRFIFICNHKAELNEFILDNGDYKVNIDAKLKFNVESTSKNQTIYNNWVDGPERKANNEALESLLNEYKLQIGKGNFDKSAKYLALNKDLQLKLMDYYKKLVTDHPDCFIVPSLLAKVDMLTYENFGSTYNKLNPEIKNSPNGRYLKDHLDKNIPNTRSQNNIYFKMVGKIAKPFVGNLVNGKAFNQASLKGKWVFLDFWASWCVYCREEIPSMKRALDKYKNKNFVISTVSVDTDNSAWKNAILEDSSQVFIHTLITDSLKIQTLKDYMVYGYPTNFLINPEGRIMDMNLRGEDLPKSLARFIK